MCPLDMKGLIGATTVVGFGYLQPEKLVSFLLLLLSRFIRNLELSLPDFDATTLS